jgi:hypothetical protein
MITIYLEIGLLANLVTIVGRFAKYIPERFQCRDGVNGLRIRPKKRQALASIIITWTTSSFAVAAKGVAGADTAARCSRTTVRATVCHQEKRQ